MKKINILLCSLMLLSFSVMAQSAVDAVKQKSLNKAQQDSVVNKATMSGTNDK